MKFQKLERIAGILTFVYLSISTFVDAGAQAVDLPSSFHTYTISQQNQPDPGHIFTVIRPHVPKYPGYLLILDNFGTPFITNISPINQVILQFSPVVYLASCEMTMR